MDSMNKSISISSFHSEQDSRAMPETYFLELEHQQWLNDPQAQSEYQQWLESDRRRRSLLPDPFQNP